MVDQKLKTLIRRRGVIKAPVTRFLNYIERFEQHEGVVGELNARLTKHERLYEEFETVQTNIEELTAERTKVDDDDDGGSKEVTIDDIYDNEAERERFEDAYFAAIAAARTIIDLHAAKNTTTCNTLPLHSTPSTNPNGVRLPVINLPEFDGRYEDWFKFHDAFCTLVDANTSLSNVQKFMYLTSSLKKPASDTIESLEISNANYPVALQLLKERYENSKLIVNSHVRAIFDLEVVANKEGHTSLRRLLDKFTKHYRVLEALAQPVNHWDTLLNHILTSKLDGYTRKTWEMAQNPIKLPTLQELLDFLKGRCQLLEAVQPNNPTSKLHMQERLYRPKTFANATQSHPTCTVCKGAHTIYQCNDFGQLNPKERMERAKQMKLCTNCLIGNHILRRSKSRNCYKCGRRHHTLLHDNTTEDTPTADQSNSTIATHSSSKTHVLLSTAWVNVFTKEGNVVKERALIDSGSDSNYISEELFNKLNRERKTCKPITVVGVNRTISRVDSIVIKSTNTSYACELTFLISKHITQDIPLVRLDVTEIHMPNGICLADDSYHVPGKIDMLIGAEIFYELLTNKRIHLGHNKPVLTGSMLGWLITGRMRPENANHTRCNFATTTNANSSTYDVLEKFWQLEDCGDGAPQSSTEQKTEGHFIKNVKRDETGRYEVALPFNERRNELGENLSNAIKRFIGTERRLERDTKLKDEYVKFMQEYEELNHVSKVRELTTDSIQDGMNEYYIPHHAVFKTSSSTTKLRVVFDASAPTSTGLSLNDVLEVGPTVQSELFELPIRFRKYKIILTADVEKMFRQVLVRKEDQPYQSIIWRDNPNKPLSIYQLHTVTYGTGPATFLTTRCINHLALLHKEAARALVKDTYVDDVIAGCNDELEAKKLREEMMKIMKNGCFNLRKWSSNCEGVLKGNTNDD